MITLPVEISGMVRISNLKLVTGRMNTRLIMYVFLYLYKISHKSAVCNIAIWKKSDSWHEQFCLKSHLLAAVDLPAMMQEID